MRNGLHIDEFGNQEWYVNGQLHREDGPARIWYDGDGDWYQYGHLHRLDGPAINRTPNGSTIRGDEYWLRGIEYNKETWLHERKNYFIQENLKSLL